MWNEESIMSGGWEGCWIGGCGGARLWPMWQWECCRCLDDWRLWEELPSSSILFCFLFYCRGYGVQKSTRDRRDVGYL